MCTHLHRPTPTYRPSRAWPKVNLGKKQQQKQLLQQQQAAGTTWQHNFGWRIQSCPRVDHQPTTARKKAFKASHFQPFNYTKQTTTHDNRPQAHVYFGCSAVNCQVFGWNVAANLSGASRPVPPNPAALWPKSWWCSGFTAGVLRSAVGMSFLNGRSRKKMSSTYWEFCHFIAFNFLQPNFYMLKNCNHELWGKNVDIQKIVIFKLNLFDIWFIDNFIKNILYIKNKGLLR